MNNREFVSKVRQIAENCRTLYVMGCFGAPLTGSNVDRYCNNHAYNRQTTRTSKIKAAADRDPVVFGFDCVCLIKAVLWGWSGDKSKTYGGAVYASNGVPDIGADAMIARCSGVSTDFTCVVPGEAVWMEGHIGVYVGDGLAVECTPIWADGVQYTACNRDVEGYHRRNWTKHGKLPYITYEEDDMSRFADVKDSDWFAEDVDYCAEQGLMNGVSEERFEPNASVTRAQLAAVAARLHKMLAE